MAEQQGQMVQSQVEGFAQSIEDNKDTVSEAIGGALATKFVMGSFKTMLSDLQDSWASSRQEDNLCMMASLTNLGKSDKSKCMDIMIEFKKLGGRERSWLIGNGDRAFGQSVSSQCRSYGSTIAVHVVSQCV